MPRFEPRNPDYAGWIATVLGSHPFMTLLGTRLGEVEPGACELHLSVRSSFAQPGGAIHGAIIGALADNAAGAAAATLVEAGTSTMTVAYKLNFLVPAVGDRIRARAHVIRPGASIIVAESNVFAIAGRNETRCATAVVTLMPVPAPIVP